MGFEVWISVGFDSIRRWRDSPREESFGFWGHGDFASLEASRDGHHYWPI